MATKDTSLKSDAPGSPSDGPTGVIVCAGSNRYCLDFSQRGSEYSRRIAQKLVQAKVPSGEWNNYNCRDGTVVHFFSIKGESIGEAQPLAKLKVCVVAEKKKVREILVRELQTTDGKVIEMPQFAKETPAETVPVEELAPLAAKPLANWNQLKTKTDTEKTGKPAAARTLPDASSAIASEVPLPPRPPGEPPTWVFDRNTADAKTMTSHAWGLGTDADDKDQWEWLKPTQAAENQLRELLEERNGDLHLKRQQANEKRRQRREPVAKGPTWIDSFFQIAKHKFSTLPNPLCRLTEVYLRPDYLSAPHEDTKSATMIVDRVVGLMMAAKKSKKTALHKFATQVLERGQVPDTEQVSIAGTARKNLSQLTNKLADPKTSAGDGLQIIMQDLGDSIRFEYEQMRKSGSEKEKLEIIDKCRGALSLASKSKAFRNCTSEQRDDLKGVINGWGDRITSYVNTNKLPQPGSKSH